MLTNTSHEDQHVGPIFIGGPPRSRTTLLASLWHLVRTPSNERRLTFTKEDGDFVNMVNHLQITAGEGLPRFSYDFKKIITDVLSTDPFGVFKLPNIHHLAPFISTSLPENVVPLYIINMPSPLWCAKQITKYDSEYQILSSGLNLALRHVCEAQLCVSEFLGRYPGIYYTCDASRFESEVIISQALEEAFSINNEYLPDNYISNASSDLNCEELLEKAKILLTHKSNYQNKYGSH